jgi:hypothetical protein
MVGPWGAQTPKLLMCKTMLRRSPRYIVHPIVSLKKKGRKMQYKDEKIESVSLGEKEIK